MRNKLQFRTVQLNSIQNHDRTVQPVVNCDKSHGPNKRSHVLNNVDCVSSNVKFSHQEALLCVLEDNEAVVKMIIKGKKSYNETCFQDSQSCT